MTLRHAFRAISEALFSRQPAGKGRRYAIRRPARRLRMEGLEGRNLMAVDLGGIMGIQSSGYETANDVAIDRDGNTFIVGDLEGGPLDFDPAATHPGDDDIVASTAHTSFVVKYNASGAFEWVRTMGDTNASTVTTDDAGNIFVGGNFSGELSLGSTTLLPLAGGQDLFVTKLTADGNYAWAHRLGTASGTEWVYDIAVDSAGQHVHIAGAMNNVPPNIVVAEIDATNPFAVTTAWYHILEGDRGLATALALDTTGNVFVTGYFQGSLDFNPGSGTFNMDSGGGRFARQAAFVWKLNTNGGFAWAKQFAAGNNGVSEGTGIAVDASGNVLVSGWFRGTVDFNPAKQTFNLPNAGSNDVFVTKLTSVGDFAWAKRIGGPNSETTPPVDSLQIDAVGNIYLTGYSDVQTDFDPGTGVVTGYAGSFIVSLTSSGAFRWVTATSGGGIAFAIAPTTMAGETAPRIAAAGAFDAAINVKPDPNPLADELVAVGSYDAFWLWFTQD